MPKNHILNPYIGIIEMFESENWNSSNQNQKIEIGIIEAEIRIEATQLTRRIVTALVPSVKCVQILWKWSWGRPHFNFTFHKFTFFFYHLVTLNSHFSLHVSLRLFWGRQLFLLHNSIVQCWGCEGGLISYFTPQTDQIPSQIGVWPEHLDLSPDNLYVGPGY